MDDVLLSLLPVKDWIVLACQIHMWSYLETESLPRKPNYTEDMRMGPNSIGFMLLHGEETAHRHRQRDDHVTAQREDTICKQRIWYRMQGRFVFLFIRESYMSLPCFKLMNYILGTG